MKESIQAASDGKKKSQKDKHQWQNDDIVMWDNRCTMHCVEPYDNTTTRRIMHRVTIVGEEKPIPG